MPNVAHNVISFFFSAGAYCLTVTSRGSVQLTAGSLRSALGEESTKSGDVEGKACVASESHIHEGRDVNEVVAGRSKMACDSSFPLLFSVRFLLFLFWPRIRWNICLPNAELINATCVSVQTMTCPTVREPARLFLCLNLSDSVNERSLWTLD